MFVNEPPTKRTIDHERKMELSIEKMDYDYAFFVLSIGEREVSIYVEYDFVGDNKEIKRYFVRSIFPGRKSPYRFSSRDEKRQIVRYAAEALVSFGLHHSLPPGYSVEVIYNEDVLTR